MERAAAFFVGGAPRLRSEEVVHSAGDRFRLQTAAGGVVHVRLGERGAGWAGRLVGRGPVMRLCPSFACRNLCCLGAMAAEGPGTVVALPLLCTGLGAATHAWPPPPSPPLSKPFVLTGVIMKEFERNGVVTG
jgi:hypothetical protein